MLGRMLIGTVIFALVLSAPADTRAGSTGLLFAANPGGEDGFEDTVKHADDKIDVFKGWIDLTVWSIVVFLILFFLLSKFAWPQIAAGLDKREQAIAHDKHEADRAKKEAAEMRTKLEAEMAQANDKIRQMMDKARQDAAATNAEELARGKAELQAERERLQRELRLSTDDALHKIWHDAAQLATSISAKTIRKELTLDDHRALVREALDEFQAADKGRLQDLKSAHA